MSPLAVTTRRRPPPWPSWTTAAVKPAGSVGLGLPAASAAAAVARDRLTRVARRSARMFVPWVVLFVADSAGDRRAAQRRRHGVTNRVLVSDTSDAGARKIRGSGDKSRGTFMFV